MCYVLLVIQLLSMNGFSLSSLLWIFFYVSWSTPCSSFELRYRVVHFVIFERFDLIETYLLIVICPPLFLLDFFLSVMDIWSLLLVITTS